MRPAQLARRSADPADDELTELLAELLVRAWQRRHPGVMATTATRTGDEKPR
jgi:hypothetical protein